jgi:hypothetical protein
MAALHLRVHADGPESVAGLPTLPSIGSIDRRRQPHPGTVSGHKEVVHGHGKKQAGPSAGRRA